MLDKTHVKAFEEYLSNRQCARLTVKNYRITITIFLNRIDKHPQDITIFDIEDYVHWMLTVANKGKPYNGNSLCSKYSAIARYIEFLNHVYHTQNPITYDKQLLHPPPHVAPPKEVLTKAEVSQIFKVCEQNHNKRDLAILKTLFFSGQRRTSIQMINLGDIDWENETVTIRFATKQKKGTRIHKAPLSGATQSIRDYIDNGRELPSPGHEQAVFLNGFGKRLGNESINTIVKKYSCLAGIRRRNYPHLWRASFITICDAGGMTRDQIKTVTGHKDIKSLDTYLHPDPTECMKKAHSILSLDNEIPSPKPIPPTPQPQKPLHVDETNDTHTCKTHNRGYGYEVLYEGV